MVEHTHTHSSFASQQERRKHAAEYGISPNMQVQQSRTTELWKDSRFLKLKAEGTQQKLMWMWPCFSGLLQQEPSHWRSR